MVRATCVLHRAGVVTAMFLSHHGDGEGAAEAVHARNHYVSKEIHPFMLPMECQLSLASQVRRVLDPAKRSVGK